MARKEKEFICKSCGEVFRTTATHANYCENCRRLRHLSQASAYQARRQLGETKIVGSQQICPQCGKKFIIKSGAQKMCAECSDKARLKSTAQYKNSVYERINFYVAKGRKQELKDFADKHNLSINQFMNAAIDLFIEQTEKAEKANSGESD